MSKKLVGKAKSKARKKNRLRNDMSDEAIEDSFNHAPNLMIHEKDYIPMNCVLCGEEMKSVHATHTADPLVDRVTAKEALETGNPNRCCSKCRTEKVMPARLEKAGIDESETIELTPSEFLKFMAEGKVVLGTSGS